MVDGGADPHPQRQLSGADERAPGVILVTGTMAAGKSTVAELLAHRYPRAAHVHGDVFRRFVVSGAVPPAPEMPAEALEQLRLRYRVAAMVADTYVRAGFTAVVQDVVIGPILAEMVDMITTRPRYLVVLDPEPAVIESRESGRAKSGYVDGWTAADLVHQLRTSTPRLGLWLDTGGQRPAETVQTILDRLADARVDGQG